MSQIKTCLIPSAPARIPSRGNINNTKTVALNIILVAVFLWNKI